MVQKGQLGEGVAAHNLKGSIFQWANENRPLSLHRFERRTKCIIPKYDKMLYIIISW